MKVFIDESVLKEKRDYAYCAVTIEDENMESYRRIINDKRKELLSDPFFDQYYNIENLKKSFHYTQDHRELKNSFINLLNSMSFEIIIHIYYDINLRNRSLSRVLYLKKLNTFLQQKYCVDYIDYVWEKDDGLTILWPDDINIQEKTKEDEQLLSIADYSLGIFRKVYLSDYEQSSRNTCLRDYGFIENKLRFIKDEKIKKPFTRRNPYVVQQ